MKPKSALVKDGFLPPGSENKRGRLSLDAINRLKELAASGWDIDGYSKATVSSPETVKSKAPVDSARIPDVPDESRPENDWSAFVGTNEIGMRTVCNVCGSSLTYCRCSQPRVWLDFDREAVVYFKPRTHPLPAKRF